MSETNLMAAHNQWATRPADERFETLEDLYLNCLLAYNNAKTQDLTMKQVSVEPSGSELWLSTPVGKMGFNNWSFNQLSTRIGAPGGYLQQLPAEIAADALNHGIKRADGLESQLYYDAQSLTLRALTSPKYGRIPNHEVVESLIKLPGKWVTPPARPAKEGQPGARLATEEDCKSSTLVQPGDWIAPAGLYGSDRDMFAFLVDPETRIDDGTDGGLSRGFFVRNSEVGNATFTLTTFLYRYICGNHIVWGASEVKSVSIKHLGRNARVRAFDKLSTELKAYAESTASTETDWIKKARSTELAPSYDEMVDLIFGQKALLPKGKVKAAYDKANEYADVDGSPRSIWGFAQGVTRISQETPFADERAKLDRAAGEILAMAN